MIPLIAEKQIYQVLTEKTDLQSFEQWLYEDDVLETLDPDLYLELISFDYCAKSKFYDSFVKYVHFYKFEADQIKEYLLFDYQQRSRLRRQHLSDV